jgi:hypothetical protein
MSVGAVLLIGSLSKEKSKVEENPDQSSSETVTESSSQAIVSIASNPEGADVYLYANCEDEAYIGTTPFEFAFPSSVAGECSYYLGFELSGYAYYSYILEEEITSPISVDLVLDSYSTEKVNLARHYKFEFPGGIGEIYLDSGISEDLSGIEYFDSESGFMLGVFREGYLQEEEWKKITFEKGGRNFTLGLTNELYELIEDAGISLEGSYWKNQLTLLPDSYIFDVPVTDGTNLMKKYSNTPQDWLLLTDSGNEYPVIRSEFGGLVYSKIGKGLFRVYNAGFIYELDLVQKEMKFIKYVDLRSFAGDTGTVTFPDISGDYLFYEVGDSAGGKSVLTRYNYITGKQKNICEVGQNLARGIGPADSSDVEKNQAGDKWISLSTFRESDSLVVFNSQFDILYKSGKKGDSYAQFMDNNEIVFVRYWVDPEDYPNDFSPKLIKRNLSTGKETVLLEGYDFYGLSFNPDKNKLIFYDYVYDSKTEKVSIYVVDSSGMNLKKVVDHGVIPYWKDNNTIGYLAVGPCTSPVEGHESDCQNKKHCYCSLGGGILGDVAYITGDHQYKEIDI